MIRFGSPGIKIDTGRNKNIDMCDRREKELFTTAGQNTGKTDIQNAVIEGDYEKAEELLQNYLKKSGLYDDVTAILDAGIGEHYGDRIRVWKAVQKGLKFNWRNYELYVMLGDYYLPENPEQAYLCYENALFYCGDPEDKRVLEQLLDQMREQYEISVNKVAIVILSCGFLEYTKVCIESIRATTSERVREIIVVDNGSRDGSVEWLREQSDIILLENEENKGYPAGCNQGIEASPVGSDIFLLNNDTVLSENTLFWLRMGLYDREENGTAGCVTNLLRDDQQAAGAGTASDPFSFGAQINVPMEYPYENRIFCAGFALLIKRRALERTGLLDERFSPGKLEDEDYGLRVLTAGYQNVLCKNSFLVHFGSVTFQKDGAEEWVVFQRNRQKLNEKWGFKTEYYLGARRDLPGLIEEPKEKPLRILEIGCGCGALMGYIKGVYPNAETFGIELIPEVARIASFMGKVWCCDVEKTEFPWENEYFDYIIMGDVLEHLMDPEKMLKRLKKHLKTGGHVLVSMPNVKCYSVMLPLLQKDEFSYRDSGILDRTHVKMYTGTEIQKLMVRSGYEIEDVTGRIAVPGPDEAEEAVIDVLCSLMEHPDKESFLIFQYLVKAVKRQ